MLDGSLSLLFVPTACVAADTLRNRLCGSGVLSSRRKFLAKEILYTVDSLLAHQDIYHSLLLKMLDSCLLKFLV